METKGPPKKLVNKTSHMSDEAFADLRRAVAAALAFERGKRGNLNVTRVQASRGEDEPMNRAELRGRR